MIYAIILLALLFSGVARAEHAWTGMGDSPGVSGGTADCPYDTYASDGCGAAPHYGLYKQGRVAYLAYASQSGQNYVTTFTGSVSNSVLTVASVVGTPFACSGASDSLCHQTIHDAGGALPDGVYIKSQLSGSAGGVGAYQLSGSGASIHSQSFSAYLGPPRNMPGVDYGIGAYTAVLSDPATVDFTSTGCTYIATGGIHNGPRINCAGGTANPANLAHLDLSAVGGHGCTEIVLNSSIPSGTVVNIDDVSLDPSIASSGCVNWLGSGGAFVFSNGAMTNVTINITNATVYGHGDDSYGSRAASGGNLNPAATGGTATFSAGDSSGNMSVTYSTFVQFPAHVLAFSDVHTTNCATSYVAVSDQTVNYNYFDTSSQRPQTHGDLSQMYCFDVGSYKGNTIVYSNTAAVDMSTIVPSDLSGAWNNSFVFDNNWMIINFAGGINPDLSDIHVDVSVANPGGGQPGTLTISNVPGGYTIYRGLTFATYQAVLYQQISPGVWTYDCGANTVSGDGAIVCPDTNASRGIFEEIPSSNISRSGVTLSLNMANNGLAAFLHGHYQYGGEIKDNWVDGSGISNTRAGTSYWQLSSGVCAVPVTISGNIDMLNGGQAANAVMSHGTGC